MFVDELKGDAVPFDTVFRGFAAQASFLMVNEPQWYESLVASVGLDPYSETVQLFFARARVIVEETVRIEGESLNDRKVRGAGELGRELGLLVSSLRGEGWSPGEVNQLLREIDRVQKPKIVVRREGFGVVPSARVEEMRRRARAFAEGFNTYSNAELPRSAANGGR